MNKIAQLEQEKAKLSSDIAKLKTQTGVEESIRDKFGLVKEGEGVVMIIDDKSEPKAVDKPAGGFFSFFKNLFK